ncbi:MAG: hypothetical protein K2N25_04360 [Muribaculaceae bacterium]|nr:hypothetical protein [Muribaculaceae bacterium]
MRSIKFYIHILCSLTLIISLSACRDEIFKDQSEVVPGLDTEVNITISLPEMTVQTRADMDENLLNRVNTLWIGVYNSKTGERTAVQSISGLGSTLTQHATARVRLTCKTGPSYIVAVANPNSNAYGAATIQDDGTVTVSTLPLALEAADTWEKYQRISIRQLTANNVNMPNPPLSQGLVMTGFFIADENVNSHPENSLGDIQSYTIPYSKNLHDENAPVPDLKGIVHLRRPFTQVKFNIELEGTLLESFELADIQIFNLPRYTWALERTGTMNETTGAPAGDKLSWTNASDVVAGNYTDRSKAYSASLLFTPSAMETVNVPATGNVVSHTRYSMDFWMFENRRTGLAECQDYADREREYQNDDYSNTSVYRSLSSEDPTLNNCATFARIRGSLKYKPDATVVDPAPNLLQREADVEYIVHLGYINPNPDPKDFNTLRNSIYTYNVKVSGAENIRVEAFQEGNALAPQPGAEGIVTDVTGSSFELDSHYAAFNIELTEDDLRDCTFSMVSYFGDREIIFDNSDNATGVNNYPQDSSDPDWKFYSWVELRRTTNQNTLASYPTEAERSGNNPIYYLADLKNGNMQAGWYTVFVNEYVYEDDYDESTNPVWHDYVNLPDRQFWIRVTESVSPDGESMYCRAKYAVSQKSIQTYYDDESVTAVGLEHTNENFGLNSRWTITASNLEGDNGRYNVWANVGGSDNGTTAGTWTTYIQQTAPMHVNAITNTIQTAPRPDLNLSAKDWPLPMMRTLAGQTASAYDPQITTASAQFVEDLYACINRNRDLNGDGRIDANEMRWYVPSSGNYVRVILGRNSLVSPVMNYSADRLGYASGEYYNTMYHYFASDQRYLWCEEGMSSDNISNTYPSWQVRCIRNLGTDLTTVSREAKIEQAYDDTDYDPRTLGGIVKVAHYYGTSLRTLAPEYLPMHKTNSLNNRLGMYGFEYAPRGNVMYTTPPANISTVAEQSVSYATYNAYNQAVINATPCEELNRTSGRTGWRVPNQKELVIIRRIGENDSMFGSGSTLMCCTQEYWAPASAPNPGYASSEPGAQFRFTTVRYNLATAQPLGNINAIRCVRDLTEEEQEKTYQQILNNE